MRKIRIVILVLCSVFVSSIYGQTSDEPQKNNQCDNLGIGAPYKNPFKGFSSFVFSAGFSAAHKKEADKINRDIEKELSFFGQVVPSSLLVQAEDKESIDFKGFAPGAFLSYEISDLRDVKGKNLGILKATLTLTIAIEACKTRQRCMPVVWSQSCFLKGTSEKKLERSVSESLKYLLEEFQREYVQVNQGKPVFNFYQS